KRSMGRIAPVAAMAACAAIVFALYNSNSNQISYKNNETDSAQEINVAPAETASVELDVLEEPAAKEKKAEEPRTAAGSDGEVTTTAQMREAEDIAWDNGLTDGVYFAETPEDATVDVYVTTAAAVETIAAEDIYEEEAEESEEETIQDVYEDFEKDDVEDETDDAPEYILEVPVHEVYSLDPGTMDNAVAAGYDGGTQNTFAYGANNITAGTPGTPESIIVGEKRATVTPSTVYSDYLGGTATVTPAVTGLPQALSPEATDELIREITTSEKEVRRDHISPSDTLYVIDLTNGDEHIRAYVGTSSVTYRVTGGSGDMFVTYELSEFPQILSSLELQR
ncbi:MAG: hypothetical protein ILP19_09240, partial [Oscillospiraceae bacterium]|nr:hypothetical protein [Oscillospiraceae bacterium]